MTDLARIEQIITRALLEGCDNHRTRAQIARQAARQVVKNLPASESRAERLMHAMEGELDGFTCDVDAAMRILAHVDAGEMEVPTIAHFVEAGRRLATNHDLAKSLSVFVDYWGLDCYTPPAEAIDAVRDIVRALLLLAQETDALSVGSARQVLEVAPVAERHLAGWKLVPADDPQRPFCDPAIPDEMVFAGSDALDKADEDLRKGVGPDWDTGMICVAVYRAMLAAAPDAPSVTSAPVPSYKDGVKEGLRRAAKIADDWEEIEGNYIFDSQIIPG
jgi:hypothetical protein